MATFNATFQNGIALNASFSAGDDLSATFGEVIERAEFEGPYSVIPSQEMQIINTRGYLMTDNFTVEPIPSNYGLITWNGSILTVS